MNTPVGSRAALEHEMQILKFREHRILTKIIEYEQAPEDELYLNSVLDMRQPAGRGDKKIDGARQQMGMYSKDSAFARVLKLQDALYKVQGRIAKIADSLRALEENEKRLELEKKRLEILRMRATGVVETPDPETGEDLPDEVDGEFCAKGYNIMKGYYKMPEATRQAIDEDGWLHTGDIGTMDEDGNFRITGRLKDMIIRGGENIYPEDIETVLNSHVCIADSIVTEQEGRLIALVHFNREEIESMIDDWREEWESKKEAWEAKTEQLKKEIMDFVNAKVNRFSRISEVVEEKEDFIKTPTHKIKRFLYNKNKNGQTPDQPAAGK